VKLALQEDIESGKWKPGERLPGEIELCELFEVSRTVIRQALNEMEHEGLVSRRKGKGTFVSEPKIKESLVQRLTGFHQNMEESGYNPVSKVLMQKVVPASSKVASYLEIEVGTPVVELVRLRYVQEEPIVLVSAFLPHALCPGLEHADFTGQSLYAYIEANYDLVIARGHRNIQAVPANEYEAVNLQVKPGAPLILLDSIAYLEDGTPIEYYHALHRGDRSQFSVELVRIREQGSLTQIMGSDVSTIQSSNINFIKK
jgi:GntR family transcriptional regulator